MHRTVRGTPLPLPCPKQNCCNSTTASLPAASPALSARHSTIPVGYAFAIREEPTARTARRGYPLTFRNPLCACSGPSGPTDCGPRRQPWGSGSCLRFSPRQRATELLTVVDYFCRPCRGSFLALLLLRMAYAMGHILSPLRGLPPAASPAISARDSTLPAGYAFAIKGRAHGHESSDCGYPLESQARITARVVLRRKRTPGKSRLRPRTSPETAARGRRPGPTCPPWPEMRSCPPKV
jgi:hypothetical protein